ncbi:MAG: TIGR02996 domain-containing protein [Proteobacteria bacterium]|nr:TIGR02996 domain-containing protein [Pseudomonadota bacterium]
MTGEDALLARIREEPDSDEPRLVYADWLQQRGDAYGEMIVLGIELDRCGDDERSKELWARIEGLPCHAD